MSPLSFDGLLVFLLILSLNSEHGVSTSKSSNKLHSRTALNFTETTARYGYKSEEHTVVTEDGYLLKLFRVRSGARCSGGRRTPVVLMHGLLLSADCWLDAGPGAGLAFLLADACLDTWVGNVRGTYYSRRHLRLDPDRDERFWNFSVDEIGLYDVPAIIDYVLKATAVPQINYIGYSQGAGTFFIMCSEKPGYCDKTKVMIALAPATRQYNTRSVLFRLIPLLVMDHKELLQAFGIWEIFANRLPTYEFMSNICQYEEASSFCELFLALLDAPHPKSISRNTLKTLFKHFLAGTSTQNMARYGQSMLGRKFGKYDYGRRKNRKVYGSESPPEYNLTAVRVPVVVLYGRNDGMVDVQDVLWLQRKLPNVIQSIQVKDPSWTHLDMAYSQNTNVMIFPDINKYLLQYD